MEVIRYGMTVLNGDPFALIDPVVSKAMTTRLFVRGRGFADFFGLSYTMSRGSFNVYYERWHLHRYALRKQDGKLSREVSIGDSRLRIAFWIVASRGLSCPPNLRIKLGAVGRLFRTSLW